MSTKIGRFEILSEIAKSDWGAVYKAHDPSNGQTVALKTNRLEMPQEQAKHLVEGILAEAESSKVLNSQHIALLYGAGEIENQFCAAMEYVQGNSIATMLARKEGFSIWDLLDISRQVCQGLDHAHNCSVFHYSLEPAKIMVQWDGTVKILGFGISTMASLEPGASGKVPPALHYASPEQVRGEPLTACSNFFTWGAILYEMVTDLKAFEGEDADAVCRRIVDENPVPPLEINKKIHAGVSDLIMKAISKSPGDRFQNGQELLAELEKCKQASSQPAKKASTPAKGLSVPKDATALASRFAGQPGVKPAPVPAAAASPKAQAKTAGQKTAASVEPAPRQAEAVAEAPDQQKRDTKQNRKLTSDEPPAKKKAAAAAAGAGWSAAGASQSPQLDNSAQSISSCGKASVEALEKENANMSAAVVEESEAPLKFAVDPMMAEDGNGGKKQVSFSELDELPPLKEVFLEPPPAPATTGVEEEPPVPPVVQNREPQKPKVQPREVAEKALKEIKNIPPKLLVYSVSAAVGLILVLVVVIALHIRSQNVDDESAPSTSNSAALQAKDVPPEPVPPAPLAAAPVPSAAEREPAAPVRVAPVVKPRFARKRTPPPAPVALVPGVLAIDSTPEGAQVRIDGRSDPGWVTPFNTTGLNPGQHTLNVSKPGYTSETRNVEVASGSKSFVVIHLMQLAATVSLTSEPTGASVYVDGKDTGRVTPTQLTLDKGTHTFVLKKQGYLDETAGADLQPGQNFHFSPTLRVLGNVDDLKTVGKVKKFFGGGDAAGRGVVTIKTLPKGAQIAVNRRLLDKASPVEFLLNPGNYVIDITLSGYKPVQRVINVEKGNKIVLDETLERD